MTKSLLCLFLLLSTSRVCSAQNTRGGLAVYWEKDSTTTQVIAAIQRSGRDTNRINLLNKLAHIYWRTKTITNGKLDSCLATAKQAQQLSRALKFVNGSNEAIFMICRVLVEKNNFTEALQLTRQVYGEEQVRLLLTIAERYVFQYHAGEKDFLKALPLIEKALKLSASTHSLAWSIESAVLLAKFHFKQGNIAAGKRDFLSIINRYHQLQDYANEAKYWSELGKYMPENNRTFSERINSQELSVKYYLLANKKKEAAYSLGDLAILRFEHNQTVQAERDLKHMLSLFKAVNEPITIETYSILSSYYRFVGKYDQALHYGLAGLTAAGDNMDKKIAPGTSLGMTYALLKDYPNAIRYYELTYNYAMQRNSGSKYIAAHRLSYTYAEAGHPKKALTFLTRFLQAHPSTSFNEQQLYASDYGFIYTLLGNYVQAEKYYLKMLNLEEQANLENGRNMGLNATLVGGTAFYIAGKFYAERARYVEAKKYLLKSLDHPQYLGNARQIDTYQLLYQVEYALGNYRAAVGHLSKNKSLADSVNSVARVNQIAELNIRYESAQKAKEIKLLEKTQRLQQLAIQRSDMIRNVTLFGAALLLLLGASAYVGYRSKQKNNLQLKRQQEEINHQNTTLQLLLSEKEEFLLEKDSLIEEMDGLLKDKDWLLREVHHRVKNNLQIIMSLLRTQLSHLKNEEARDAIIECEGRVQAISLIHQKLYTTDKLASISMPAYVADLVQYLSNGLNTGDKKIRFTEAIELIHVGLAQAVPLGLILNEAITNAIKYGDNAEGVAIDITFRRVEGSLTELKISDQGKGLPADFDLIAAKSLGMQMMKGLTNQLKGHFSISSTAGVTVSVQFKTLN